jgi:hypothetical protein
MSEEISATFEAHREASQRFDYFILGLSVALVAYAGKTLQPEKFGINPYTLEVASLLALIASIIIGFKRIEQTIVAHLVRFKLLDLRKSRGTMTEGFIEGKTRIMPERGEKWTPDDMKREIDQLDLLIPDCERKFEEVGDKAAKFYSWRNALLICGFIGYFFSKLLLPYCQ